MARSIPSALRVLMSWAITLSLAIAEDAPPATPTGPATPPAPATPTTPAAPAAAPAPATPGSTAPPPTTAPPAAITPAESAPPTAPTAPPAPPPWAGIWVPATGALAKETWGTGGIGTLVTVPGSGEAVAAIDGTGLWSSADAGRTWKRLGQQEKTLATRPCRILIDPDHPATWWIAAGGSPGIFATSDAGVTMRHLGSIDDVRDLDVDFADPKRELMLAGVRAKERGLERSNHGGTAWGKAGARFPDKTAPPEHPLILDAKTWLVATAGEAKGREAGIFRTEDAGTTWRKVFSKGSEAAALRLSKSIILWGCAGSECLAISKDAGRSWDIAAGPARSSPISLPGGWIAALGESRIMASNDSGRSWSAIGPELPSQADGLAYSASSHCFFAYRAGATASPEAILRLDVPDDLAAIARPPVTRKVLVWDGDDLAGGGGFTSPKEPPNQLSVQQEVARVGRGALLFRAKNTGWCHCGWGWDPAKVPKLDPAVCKKLVYALKIVGDKMPTSGTVFIGGLWAPLETYCATPYDGAWHDVVIPVHDLDDGKLDLAAVTNLQLRFNSGADIDISVYIDEIGFTDGD